MIQRVQTVFFLIVLAISLLLMFTDLVYFVTSEEQNTVEVSYQNTHISSDTEQESLRNTALFSLLAVVAVLALFATFSYKNRKLQATVTAFNAFASLAVLAMMWAYSYRMDYFESDAGQLRWAALIPLALFLFNFLGLRAIKRDERLIRSMDRLR